VKCNTQTSRTRKSLHLPLLFLRSLMTLLGYLSVWKGNWVVCGNLWISDFYQCGFGLFDCLKLSLVRRSKPSPLGRRLVGSLWCVFWNRLGRGSLWGYAVSCLSLDFPLNMRLRRKCCRDPPELNSRAWQEESVEKLSESA